MIDNESINYKAVGPSPLEELKSLEIHNNGMYSDLVGFVLPNNNKDVTIIDNIIYNMKNNSLFDSLKSKSFNSEKEMDDYASKNSLLAGIIFESDDYLQYTIRVNGTDVPDPNADPIKDYGFGRYQIEGKNENNESFDQIMDKYMDVFLPVQVAVDQAIIQQKTNDNSFSLIHYIGKLGKPPIEYSFTKEKDASIISYYIGTSFIMTIITVIVFLVEEKENKTKDGLLMTGVHPTIFWASWLIIYTAIIFIIALLSTILFYFTKGFGNLNPLILFIAIFFYGISCCNISFLFSSFFKSVKAASNSVSVVAFLFIFCSYFQSYFNVNLKKICSFFISPLSVGSFINDIYLMKGRDANISFNEFMKSDAFIYFLGLIFSCVLYFLLAVYFDNLFSGDNCYLFKKNIKIKNLQKENETTYEKDIQDDFNARNNEKCRVEISNVYKIFKRKNDKLDGKSEETKLNKDEFLAVNDVSFKVYENEIFAILGHNGAGKTTLINIMVGILKASSGDVYFDGRSISSSINEIRKDIGICGQNNIIYDNFTVEEHIKFYADLKNTTVDIDEVLIDLDLLQQKEVKASKLSGGQKRKLCISLALIGNPKYIFLDEPTTGLDPLSRRKIWELLQRKKEGRVIFLSTHYMDEADILADRKLILNKGKIRCLGTSLYLKNHFNMSYNLNIETQHKDSLNQLIKDFIPEAHYCENPDEDNIYNSVRCYTWKLPLNSTNNFHPLLENLEIQKNNNYIQKYALTMPTLEELFIRLEDEVINTTINNYNISDNEKQCLVQTENELPMMRSIDKPSRMKHLLCLIKYRLKIFLKDKTFAISSIVFPVITTGFTFFIVNKLLNTTISNTTINSNIISVPTMYNNTIINYDSNSTFVFPQKNIIDAIGSSTSLTFYSVNEIPYPQANKNSYLSSVTGEKMDNNYIFNVYYNDTMTHSLPATINSISNAILSSNNVDGKIITKSQPFKLKDNSMIMICLTITGILLGMCLIMPLSKFGSLATHERVNQLLQQLQLNGVSRSNYWISSFVSDILIFLITSILIVAVGVVVKFEPLLDVKTIIVIIVSLIIWSAPTLLYQYILSFFFKKESTAVNGINIINMYSIIIGFLIFNIVDNIGNSKIENIIYNNCLFSYPSIIFNIIFTMLVPSYSIITILNALFNIRIYSSIIDFSFKTIINFRNGISPIIITLLLLIIIYYIVLIKLDQKKNQTSKDDIKKFHPTTQERYEFILKNGDDDVFHEFEYVKEHQKELPISVLHLSKEFRVPKPSSKKKLEKYNSVDRENFTYGQIHRSMFEGNKLVKTAVVDVNFGVRNHECFGLLGPNGAGKSTTLNTITSTIPQTTGTISFNGVETHLARLCDISMGYCPQKDILWKELTLREHIELFISIRGYSSEEAKNYATQFIDIAGLEEHQNKRIEKLSGGTKRKLSLIIAICGYPEQILLDEPTAGMDPSTRRLIWNIITKTKKKNDSAFILTTHSMEEAENLCDRLGILVNGRIICIGSAEHLKMKYGESYVLELQSNSLDQFDKDFIESGKLFDGKEYKKERSSENRMKYEVKMTDKLGSVFEIMEQCKIQGLVQDYSFSQTSLEQVFINFAKEQVIEPDN
ncbi:P-loop containing nucleoside triphosphate hydrolase protein [Piromyces finnis]|uniref:p-loop containing nucleoside triphosphate hydrolase protein n=1 Tax=Piromyces finnis TaxID=1754191 RepID=A0A1Y1UTM1_9FUNG|nr:P-loop containing nucleoside triphosphate hydrolase protein [Piromyces finnis]|eukprot:ORX41368.1 P-loop containing nucleoside triphosphate hydrolase protein [Piromyces finnis]